MEDEVLSFSIVASVGDFISSTKVAGQIKDVDTIGLFTNPWFLVPFAALLGHMFYRQAWRDIVIMAIFMAAWHLSGTEYMQTLLVGDELQINKVLPVVFGGALALGLVVYLLVSRD
jgi:hypothetical protein